MTSRYVPLYCVVTGRTFAPVLTRRCAKAVASIRKRCSRISELPANFYQAAAYVWRDLPVPVIGALQGVVFGAGLQIALGADLRFARPDAQLSIMETKWGIIPDMGITTLLPGLVSYDKACELAMTGRIVSGDEAATLGLVTSVADDPLAAAQQTAARLASRSPDAVRAIKTLFREAWGDRDAALLRREAELQMKVMAAPNMREAVAANVEGRRPEFSDPDG